MSNTAQPEHVAHGQFHRAGHALQSLVASLTQLVATLWSGAIPSRGATSRVLTPREEADQVRAMADDVLSGDPCFAQELYAAAARHELAALRSSLLTPISN